MYETDIRKCKKKKEVKIKEMNEEREENIKGSGRRNRHWERKMKWMKKERLKCEQTEKYIRG